MKKFNLLLIISAIISMGCNGQSAKKETSSTPSVYIIGNELEGEYSKAIYWKDGVKTEFTNEDNFVEFSSIVLNGNDVYIAGYEFHKPCYWKNGKQIMLENDSDHSRAYGIAISGNDIYIAGESGTYACFWKNGKFHKLNDKNTTANSIAISGSDIYMAGIENYGDFFKACYWKNGKKHYLKTDEDMVSYARKITIIGNDVYIFGNCFLDPDRIGIFYDCYWKNGEIATPYGMIRKSNFNAINAFFISGNDVYWVGSEFDGEYYFARVWKNNVKMELENSSSTDEFEAIDIFVIGGDVHVVGKEGFGRSTICLWKNGKQTVIEESKNQIEIKSILVQ